MLHLTQSKLNNPPLSFGNCFATSIACILHLPIEEVPNVETLFDLTGDDKHYWWQVIKKWLNHKGYKIYQQGDIWEFHNIAKIGLPQSGDLLKYIDQLYFVSGITERGTHHITIYKNGKLYWDVHPSRSGLIKEDLVEILIKI